MRYWFLISFCVSVITMAVVPMGAQAQSVPPLGNDQQGGALGLIRPAASGTVDFRYAPMPRTEYVFSVKTGGGSSGSGPYFMELTRDGRDVVIHTDGFMQETGHKYYMTEKGLIKNIDVGRGVTSNNNQDLGKMADFLSLIFPNYVKDPKKVGQMVAVTQMRIGRYKMQVRHEYKGEGTKGRSPFPGYILKTSLVHAQSGTRLDVGHLVVDKESFMPIDMKFTIGDGSQRQVVELYRVK
ncbi:MAG: hypothetical protein ACPGOY_16560 [Rhodospirillaceae bacterium]